MDQTDEPAVTPEPMEQDEPKANRIHGLERASTWTTDHPVSAILLCLAPVGLAILFPNWWVQCVCLIWGVCNLAVLGRVLFFAKDLRANRRLVISFAAIIAVTQVFGAAYAATMLTGDAYRHFRFTPYSTAADFNNRRLAAQILAETHAQSVQALNAYVAEQIELGKALPDRYPFSASLRRRPCPNDGVALLIFYLCDDSAAQARPDQALYKAEQWFEVLFKVDAFSDTMSVMMTDDSRGSAVAATSPQRAKDTFFEQSGGALLTYFYRLETAEQTAPTRADRRSAIEYLSEIAKTTIRDFGFESASLLPNDSSFAGNRGIHRIETAVADALLCAQYPEPNFRAGRCAPVAEFEQWVSDEGWDAPGAEPRAILSSLRPLDLLLTSYLTEILYWDIQSMEDASDRRDLVINGIIFSAMAVMTSGFADMSPISYLAKSLLIFQFLAYVGLIILILPMSFERPKED